MECCPLLFECTSEGYPVLIIHFAPYLPCLMSTRVYVPQLTCIPWPILAYVMLCSLVFKCVHLYLYKCSSGFFILFDCIHLYSSWFFILFDCFHLCSVLAVFDCVHLLL